MFPGSTIRRLAQQSAVQAIKKGKHADVLFREAKYQRYSNTDALNDS